MNDSNTSTIVLLDAHAILHRAYHALPDFSATSGEPTGALYGVVTMLLKIIEDFSPDAMVACFDLPEPTYRHEAYTNYKATRSKTDSDLITQIDRSRDIFRAFGIPIYEYAGFEADDILGTISHQLRDRDDIRVIIASGDMDTMQCVAGNRVQVFTLKKGIKDTVLYNESTIVERFGFGPELIPDYKGLRGDASDNIPGIVGIGEKTATTLITSFGGLEHVYATLRENEQALRDVGITPRMITLLRDGEEEAMFSKMLATIRTDAPISYELPTHPWYDALDENAIQKLFNELSFRTLGERVRSLRLAKGASNQEYEDKRTESQNIDETEIEKTAIALWLLESEITNPGYEDIMSYGRARGLANDFITVQTAIFDALDAHDLRRVYETIELPLRGVIATMERHGVRVDTDYFASLSTVMHKELDALRKKIHEYAGTEFNINSPKQLGDILYDTLELKPKQVKKTAGGQRSTRESELEKMRDDHPIVEYVLQYRATQKLVSTYVDTLPSLVEDDGRIHPNFLQTGTVTGRMACKDPNLQNIPTRSDTGHNIRAGFVAAPSHQLVSIDYSQIELRIAAILSRDSQLIDIFRRGEDIHTGVAVRVFKVSAEDVTSEMRRRAKVINFGILYGMGVNALRENLGAQTPRSEAQEFLNTYFATFTELAEYLDAVKARTRRDGYTTTLFGRRRYFPAIRSQVPHLRAHAERMAINAPVQGTAADVIRIAMNQVFQRCQVDTTMQNCAMISQVHDELLFEVPEDDVAAVVPKLVHTMESVLENEETHQVPIVVDVALGETWGTLRPWRS
jgi:DNA polymerase-1